MTPKRRFLSGMFGGRVDRLPAGSVTSVVTKEQMQTTGCFFPEAHYDVKKMVKLAAAAHTIIGYDAILPYFSVWIEGAALLEGKELKGEMDWGTPTRMPVGHVEPWETPDQVSIPDDDEFLQRTAPSALLEAISILRSQFPEVVIVGKVFGPWTLGYHVAGVENILINTRLDPDKIHGFVEALKELPVIFGRAQVEAGIDVLIIGDHATGDLVSAECYRDFLLRAHQELVKKIGCPIVLHICGDTLDRLGYITQTGFDCFHFDSKVNAVSAKEVTRDKMSLMGNINNPQTLLYGTPEDVKREAEYAAKAGVEILAPECAIPTNVPDENLKAIVQVAKQYP